MSFKSYTSLVTTITLLTKPKSCFKKDFKMKTFKMYQIYPEGFLSVSLKCINFQIN